MLSRQSYSFLPDIPGVYFFKDASGKIIYIGKAKNLKKRVKSYFLNRNNLGPKTTKLVQEIEKVDFLPVESEIEALLLEANLIRKHQPTYNVLLKDGSNYPLIKITASDKVPGVFLVRKEENDGSLYFGPYTSTSSVRFVLKLLRKTFPYVSVKNHPDKHCFYHHLGLCPCPDFGLAYRKTIKNIIVFLRGEKNDLINNLTREMNSQIKKLNFEEAREIKKKISWVIEVTASRKSPSCYIENPNLREDLRKLEADGLAKIVGFFPSTIEAYDISDISGKYAVGSMVRFENGEADKSMYRRFRIKRTNTPNDFAMLAEVLERRFSHANWPVPDVILIDGGKGQISAVYNLVPKKNGRPIVLGLAKRQEEVIIPNFLNNKLTFTVLTPSGPEINLLKRVRDEAHRFAQNYHHFLMVQKIKKPLNEL